MKDKPWTWEVLPAFSALLLLDSNILLIVSLSVLLGKRSSASTFVAPQTQTDLDMMRALIPESKVSLT